MAIDEKTAAAEIAQKLEKKITSGTPQEIIARKRSRVLDRNDIFSFIGRALVMVLFLYGLFGVIFGLRMVPDDDMKPRLFGGDLVLFYRLQSQFHAGDVIELTVSGRSYVSRVAATGGDTVEITEEGSVIVNGSAIVEDQIYYVTKPYNEGISFPVTLGDDEVFVLSDFREGARDSRFFGPVSKDQIDGLIITVLRRNSL